MVETPFDIRFFFFGVEREGIMKEGTALHEATAPPLDLEADYCAYHVSMCYNIYIHYMREEIQRVL